MDSVHTFGGDLAGVATRAAFLRVYLVAHLSKGYTNFPASLLRDATDPERHYHLSAKAQEFNEVFDSRDSVRGGHPGNQGSGNL